MKLIVNHPDIEEMGYEERIIWPTQQELRRARRSQPAYQARSFDPEYHRARQEYAWLLRAEGLKYKQIGERIGCGQSRAQQIVRRFSYKVRRAVKKTRWSIT